MFSDFDLCQNCHGLTEFEHGAGNHKFNHHVMLCALHLVPEQERKFLLVTELVVQHIQHEINGLQHSHSAEVSVIVKKEEEVQRLEQESLKTRATDGRDSTHWQQNEDEAEKADLPREKEKRATEIELISIGEGLLAISQETKTPSEEDDFTHEKEKISCVKLATKAGQAGPSPNEDVTKENDPLETTNPSQEEPEGHTIQDKENKPKVISQSAAAAPFAISLASEMRKKFSCGHCSVPISLSTDFFVCVGHDCRGALLSRF